MLTRVGESYPCAIPGWVRVTHVLYPGCYSRLCNLCVIPVCATCVLFLLPAPMVYSSFLLPGCTPPSCIRVLTVVSFLHPCVNSCVLSAPVWTVSLLLPCVDSLLSCSRMCTTLIVTAHGCAQRCHSCSGCTYSRLIPHNVPNVEN